MTRTKFEANISPVFWIEGGHGAFQKVGNVYNLYDRNGDYFGGAKSFRGACELLEREAKK